jgi:hypothetical protein
LSTPDIVSIKTGYSLQAVKKLPVCPRCQIAGFDDIAGSPCKEDRLGDRISAGSLRRVDDVSLFFSQRQLKSLS